MQHKERLIELLKYLYLYTDDEHSVGTTELAEVILGENTQARRKTIKADIAALEQSADVDIICKKGAPDRYNWGSRLFDTAEIKFLIDCVSSSGIITEKMREKIISKLKSLVSISQAKKMDSHVYSSNHLKTSNQQILYVIDLLIEAIYLKKKVSFQYWRYAPTKEKIYINDGENERSSPYDLIIDNGRYYLAAYSETMNKIVAYRLDRISNLKIEVEEAVDFSKDFIKEICLSDAFKNDIEEHTKVELLCDNMKMDVIMDYFGFDTEIEIVDKDRFKVEVEVKIVDTFFAWIFQAQGKLRILGPEWVKEEFERRVREAVEHL